MKRSLIPALCLATSCATVSTPPPAKKVVTTTEESHFGALSQLTLEGENAEAYWRFDGKGVSLQRRGVDDQCDRIFTMPIIDGKAGPMTQLSSGKGATTCAHYLAGDDEVLYASTHLGGEACPPKPDMRQGYVWALYDSYDIFKTKADGSGALQRLTETAGYDAEATVCAKDGSIIFTSTRDGDIELYRMDKDGKNVKRLTFTPGYDGGAFFNADCSKIVWRASRPKPGRELEDFQGLLKQGLVRPSKLELFVANADGSEARQVTYLNAASFAPFFFPNRDRILFSSNYGDPKGRDFDIWAINTDGTQLERITYTPGFDGFPMFSPDGQWLIFASNRMTDAGKQDTNLFLTKWIDHDPKFTAGAAERILDDATWLADPAREGRGIGTKGLEAAGEYLEAELKKIGLETSRVPFDVVTAVTSQSTLSIAGKPVTDFTTVGWSTQGEVKGKAVLAGWGIQDAELGLDDFKGVDVKGKIVIARRFVPENEKLSTPEAQRRAGDLRKKAFVARSLGARALIVVDWPVAKDPKEVPPEAALPVLRPEGTGEAGLPVVVVKRAAFESSWKNLESRKSIDVAMKVALTFEKTQAFNVVGRIAAGKKAGGAVIIGAHYDHLGLGGHNSLAPDKKEPHLGADDNASGTATLLEIARVLNAEKAELTRDVIITAFSGEEDGVLGSSALVRSKPEWMNGAIAMLNLDMVGRLRANELTVLGAKSAAEWEPLVVHACAAARVQCNVGGDGYGPSDQTSFYAAGLPVLHFFTGAHGDYHKPSDAPAKLNAGGMAQIAQVVAGVTRGLGNATLTYQKLPSPTGPGDARSFNASLGTVPNYGGQQGVKGVLLDDVRPGGGADKAGMKRGDVIVKLGKYDINSVEDLMFVLMQAKPGETVGAAVLRDGKRVEMEATFQEGRRR
ncbi:MAG: peptidase M28 [Archangium gephyra]|uniref:Peptidase M28 n=1 Tax=Archangium gephyra TaxID=48 RepID=A0A2W5TAL1_9BACT|nr:MAG: peptidase M28 [Archangium gephyra]